MKKLVLAALLTHSLVAQAYNYFDWDHPSKSFDSSSKIRTSVKVEWISVMMFEKPVVMRVKKEDMGLSILLLMVVVFQVITPVSYIHLK